MGIDFKTLLDLAAIIGVVVFGIFAVIGWFDKAKKSTEDEAEKTETKVINLLKDQVSVLERKVEEQATILAETAKKLDELAKENKVLRDVLQGRDKTMLEYQEAGRDAMRKGEEIYKMVQEIKVTVEKISHTQLGVN